MIIKTNGATTVPQLENIVKEVVGKVEDQLGQKVEHIRLKDAEIGVLLTVNGEEQYLTVTHDDFEEIFTTFIQLDERGEIARAKDNEEESFLDDYTRSLAKGEKPLTYEKIESIYNDEDLTYVAEVGTEELRECRYLNKEGQTVIRYYQEGVGLIAELTQK